MDDGVTSPAIPRIRLERLYADVKRLETRHRERALKFGPDSLEFIVAVAKADAYNLVASEIAYAMNRERLSL